MVSGNVFALNLMLQIVKTSSF